FPRPTELTHERSKARVSPNRVEQRIALAPRIAGEPRRGRLREPAQRPSGIAELRIRGTLPGGPTMNEAALPRHPRSEGARFRGGSPACEESSECRAGVSGNRALIVDHRFEHRLRALPLAVVVERPGQQVPGDPAVGETVCL